MLLREWPVTLSTVPDEGKQDTFIYRNFQIRHSYEGWYVCNHSDFTRSYPRLSVLIEDLNHFNCKAASQALSRRMFKKTTGLRKRLTVNRKINTSRSC